MKYEPLQPGYYYHIYNRGNNRENIFKEEKNYDYFLRLSYKHLKEVAMMLAYCLMPNHYHFIIKTNENSDSKTISQKFSNLFNAYSKAINKQYNRDGSLFKDRFSRKKVETEAYLKNLILYVHTNPTHHKFIGNYTEYPHSSYNSILENTVSFLDSDFTLQLFSDRENFVSSHKQFTIKEDLTGFENV